MKTVTIQIKNLPLDTKKRLQEWCKLNGNVDYRHLLETDKRLKNIVL